MLLLLIGVIIKISRACAVDIANCPYEETVNLSNYASQENGSIFYQNIEITKAWQGYYDYEQYFNGVNVNVAMHLRGCVCKFKKCVKLCCQRSELINGNGQCITNIGANSSHSSDFIMITQTNGEFKKVDIFNHFIWQMGRPCNRVAQFHSTAQSNWSLLENGTLKIRRTEQSMYYTTRDYCLSQVYDDHGNEYTYEPFSCVILNPSWDVFIKKYGKQNRIINETMFVLIKSIFTRFLAMLISIIFFIPTVLIYLSFKELHGNLGGKLLISYLISLTMSYSVICYINFTTGAISAPACLILGYAGYFFVRAAFFWLSILSFDIWRNVKENLQTGIKSHNKLYWLYSLLVWGVALLCTMLTALAEWSKIDSCWKPGIGTKHCWLDVSKWSASIYFYIPNMIIFLFNVIIFFNIISKINHLNRNLTAFCTKRLVQAVMLHT
uniref:G-protein coupled receptors family 2 profile 2 domain-containing protein n=1 Tax=Glossina morsitans morsitans TaxID=37546 RepID=A0A1B0FGD4_GLOMM